MASEREREGLAFLLDIVRGLLVMLVVVGLGLVALLSVAGVAAGQPVCADPETMRERLLKRHGETPHARGLAVTGNLVEILTNDRGGWSLVIITPLGSSCLAAQGTGWQDLPAPDHRLSPERP